jgi:hypothetical protein
LETLKWRMEGDNRVDFYNKIVWYFDLDSQFQWHPFLMMVIEMFGSSVWDVIWSEPWFNLKSTGVNNFFYDGRVVSFIFAERNAKCAGQHVFIPSHFSICTLLIYAYLFRNATSM